LPDNLAKPNFATAAQAIASEPGKLLLTCAQAPSNGIWPARAGRHETLIAKNAHINFRNSSLICVICLQIGSCQEARTAASNTLPRGDHKPSQAEMLLHAADDVL
jgi:hypothetical protein